MCQQHPQFLTAYRLHMHRTIKPRPHHLRYAARIVAVRLVDLRLQHRLHVPRLNADHMQSCFGESAEQPLRRRSSFQPNSLEVVGGVLQQRQHRFRFARHLYFPNDLACVIHNADARLLVEPMLIVRRTLREQVGILHRRLLAIVLDDEVCRRLMTTPGVGPVVALTYRATVDVPARFQKSKAVGAVFGLTCAKYQSGEVDRNGRISRCGDEMMRVMLYEAAQSMLRSKKWSSLKSWAMQIARRRGMKKSIVALARRLAVIMHRIWVDGTAFRWTREVAAA